MEIANAYLKKHQFIKPDISKVPFTEGLLKYIVVIPAYCEPDVFNTLLSLKRCTLPINTVEVFILINFPLSVSEKIKAENKALFSQLTNWSKKNNLPHLTFIPLIIPDLPDKHAGAGLARKILMDSACQRFSEQNIEDGIILSLDADTIVPKNYLSDLEKKTSDKKNGCFIFNFKHPLNGDEFSPAIYNAITLYELHLRYYKLILQSTGYPFYQYTIGSCFAVRALTYMQAGGMSRRKGGEDFYFLHKIFPNTQTVFLQNTYLSPSPRASWRVPFGTGPAIKKIIESEQQQLLTYHPKSFFDLKPFIKMIPLLWEMDSTTINHNLQKLPKSILSYLISINIIDSITEIKNNCSSQNSFTKRFFNWFDAFKVLKYLNYARDNYYVDIHITKATNIFLETNINTPSKLLEILRKKDELL